MAELFDIMIAFESTMQDLVDFFEWCSKENQEPNDITFVKFLWNRLVNL